jgi:hypothetical protein
MENALPGVIHGYADASFADIPDTRLSSIGYVFPVNGGAVSWRSTKAPLQVLNAAEAEIQLCQECLFLRKLCIEMGFHQHRPTIICEDCEAVRGRTISHYGSPDWGSVPQPAYLTSHLRLLQLRISADLSDHTNNLRTVIALIGRRDTLSQVKSKTSTQIQHNGLR